MMCKQNNASILVRALWASLTSSAGGPDMKIIGNIISTQVLIFWKITSHITQLKKRGGVPASFIHERERLRLDGREKLHLQSQTWEVTVASKTARCGVWTGCCSDFLSSLRGELRLWLIFNPSFPRAAAAAVRVRSFVQLPRRKVG